MLDFETICNTRGEGFIFEILHIWETRNRINHSCDMSLEDRWSYFLRATEPCATAA